MNNINNFDTDICALASTQGHGAIAVIRTSGKESIKKLDKLFVPGVGKQNGKQNKSLKSLEQTSGYTMRYGCIYDSNKLIDEVMVAIFKAPHSYTGENSVEIYCHGSTYIISEIIKLLLNSGFKMAEPGEFSKRAYLNGKMDLAQTEAVADLIASETSSAHAIAMQQMRGGFSEELKQMRNSMLKIVSLMELELDFSEEEVEFADRTELKNLLSDVTKKVDSLISSFALGNVIKNGVPVAIVGATNTGKSTLLNALCGEERAIVSDIHGTTRDSIEDIVNIGGIMFRFIDTAGIRETKDAIEVIGIERTYAKLKEASIVIMMLDSNRELSHSSDLADLAKRIDLSRQKLIIVLNKADEIDSMFENTTNYALKSNNIGTPNGEKSATYSPALLALIEATKELCNKNGLSPAIIFALSAKKRTGIEELKEYLADSQKHANITAGSTIITNMRHYQALCDTKEALLRTSASLIDDIPTDLVAEDIREALYHLGTIVGEVTTDEILGNIFKNFCIGK